MLLKSMAKEKNTNNRSIRLSLSLLAFIALLTPLLFSAGCGKQSEQTFRIDNQASKIKPEVTASLLAGVAIRDITPPPGMPKAGYSTMGSIGDGFRTRLKARAFYLQDKEGDAAAIIQLDLTAGSLLLQHAVAERLAKTTPIDAGNLILTATHTHSGPGNYFSNNFYNKHTSNIKWLEPNYFEFLVHELTTAVETAYKERKPAKISSGRRDVWGYNRNRSIKAWQRNKVEPASNDETLPLINRAVNPALYMVRIDVKNDQGDFVPLGAISSFSVHAVALPAPETLFNGDIFAYMQRDLEWNIQSTYQPQWPVAHGIATGTQGDMNPHLPWSGDKLFGHVVSNWRETRKLGQGVADEAWELFQALGADLSDDLDLKMASRELNISEENTIGNVEICQEPAVGNALSSGAQERRTPFVAALPFLKAGSWGARQVWPDENRCQGNKRILGFGTFQPLVEPTESFPDKVLFMLLQLGDFAMVPLPFEISTMAGAEIATGVQSAYQQQGKTLQHIMVTSNANGYLGYSVTSAEFQQQEYEGGHTLYGKNSTPYLAAQMNALAVDLLSTQGGLREIPTVSDFQLTTTGIYPKAPTKKPNSENDGRRITKQPFYQAAISTNEHEENQWAITWQDVPPALINFHRPLVSIEVNQNGDEWKPLIINQQPISDEGYDIAVRHEKNLENGNSLYSASWLNPSQAGNANYRFVIQSRSGSATLYSETFSMESESNEAPSDDVVLR